MPKSNYGGKRWSLLLLKRLHSAAPLARIVDVGPGVGTYVQYRRENQRWIGIEAWGPYVKTYGLEAKYDQVIVSDIRYFDWAEVAPIDVVILGDMLEHMTKTEALRVVDKALTHARVVLVSIPIIHSEQGELEGNPFEVHVKEDWTQDEALQSFPDWCVSINESYMGVYLLTRQAADRQILTQNAATIALDVERSGEFTGDRFVRIVTKV